MRRELTLKRFINYSGRRELRSRLRTISIRRSQSKKIENHAYAVSLHYMFYNFCRIHKTLRVTPAMAAKVTDKLWSVEDIVQVIDDWEAVRQAA
jgi:hypothetical protein